MYNYIRENPELTLTDTYADNGFTGTRFDRPEFERMMQDIRTGKIQCIVVKDLSRFGRDYIETGSYLETIFPMLHELIKRIYVGMDNSVEVEFKCSDPYQEVLAIMSEVQNE